VRSAYPDGLVKAVELEDGTVFRAAEVLVAIDDLGRVEGGPEGLSAVGDVTGVSQFTHVAKYQGRAVAANIAYGLRGAGEPRRLDYRVVPRVVFSSPEVAAVGLSEREAELIGVDVRGVTVDMTSITRPYSYETEPRGMLRLLAEADSGVVVGAWAVGPLAGEWIHVAALVRPG
jgi:dihydrolipoamide dehydrogenase